MQSTDAAPRLPLDLSNITPKATETASHERFSSNSMDVLFIVCDKPIFF